MVEFYNKTNMMTWAKGEALTQFIRSKGEGRKREEM